MGEIFFEKFEVAIYSNVQLKNNCKFTYWALLSLREISAISLWYAKSWRVGYQPLSSISNRICWYLEALNNILFSSMSAIISFLLFQFLKAQRGWPSLNQVLWIFRLLSAPRSFARCCWISWLRRRQVQIPRNDGKLCRPEGQLQNPLRMPKPQQKKKIFHMESRLSIIFILNYQRKCGSKVENGLLPHTISCHTAQGY